MPNSNQISVEWNYSYIIQVPWFTTMSCIGQWRSQILKSGWAQAAGGRKSPSGVQGRSPGRGPGAKRPDIYREFAANVFLRRFVAECVLCLPYPPKNRICPNPMTRHGRGRVGGRGGGHVPTPPVATLVALTTCTYCSEDWLGYMSSGS